MIKGDGLSDNNTSPKRTDFRRNQISYFVDWDAALDQDRGGTVSPTPPRTVSETSLSEKAVDETAPETHSTHSAKRGDDDIQTSEQKSSDSTHKISISEKASSFADVVEAAYKPKDSRSKLFTSAIKQNSSKIDSKAASFKSLESYYMERDFRYYFQHPYFRITVAYLVTFCNFLIYAEDPIAHSEQECFIPVIGNCFSFVFTKYPSDNWKILKVIMWIAAMLCGLVAGKLLFHKLILKKLFRLKMFADDQGSWMIMFFTVFICLFAFAWLYNGFLLIGGDSTIEYRITEKMGIKNSLFMKCAATGTWCGDFFTAWLVTDIMLQETELYPDWAKGMRRWWNKGYNRIVLFWCVVLITMVVVVTLIATNWIDWDRLNRDFIPSTELSRAFLASFILVMDLLIVMQDWDFPHFINNFNIKLPGMNTSKLTFNIPKCLKRETWIVHITGKWFNYGIIFVVMLLDLNMWKNQIFYSPFEYGQYVGPDDKIFSVLDEGSLMLHNNTVLNYEWRSNNSNPETNRTYKVDDLPMNSRFIDYPLKYKGIAFVPSLAAFVIFGLFIWIFGRWHPTSSDRYGGRLKKKYRPRRVTRWRKLRAFFYAKSKFDARLRSHRKRVGQGVSGSSTRVPPPGSTSTTQSTHAPIATADESGDVSLASNASNDSLELVNN